jgi:hypothetical protein
MMWEELFTWLLHWGCEDQRSSNVNDEDSWGE